MLGMTMHELPTSALPAVTGLGNGTNPDADRAGVPGRGDSVDEVIAGWARARPDLDASPVGVILRLARIRDHIDRSLRRVFADFGLSPADFALLATVSRLGARRHACELAAALQITPGTLSVRVDRLANAGLIRREPDPRDSRAALVSLTSHGQAVFDTAAPAHLANEAALLTALTPAQRQQLAGLLRILLLDYEDQVE